MLAAPSKENRTPRPQPREILTDTSWLTRTTSSIRSKLDYLINHPGFRSSPLQTLGRLCRWRIHCALGLSATVPLRKWEAKFYLPPIWSGGGATMIYAVRDSYEPELALLERFLKPGAVFIDGGANFGIYSIAAAKLVGPSGRVLSFEPGRTAFTVLQQNIHLNHLYNTIALHKALADRPGAAKLFHHPHGLNSFSLGAGCDSAEVYEEVEMTCLDAVHQEYALKRVDFIKLDVEGAEELVLRGAVQVLTQCRPPIIFEINSTATKNLRLSPDGAFEFLRGLGYQFFLMGDSGGMQELPRWPTGGNVLALPNKWQSTTK